MLEAVEGVRDGLVDIAERAWLSLTEPVLELCEGLLDGIEVRAVGRQEEAVSTGVTEGLADGFGFVAAEIVEDDDIAVLEGGDQEALDVGEELLAVDRPVEEAGRVDAAEPEGGDEGECSPAAMRGLADQPLAARPPAAERRHVGLGPGLVDEYQPPRVDAGLPGPPSRPAAGDVGPVLFTGERGFF